VSHPPPSPRPAPPPAFNPTGHDPVNQTQPSTIHPFVLGASVCALTALVAACGTPADDTMEPATSAPTPGLGPDPAGAPGAAWVGKTYLLRTSAGDWTTPRGIGQDIGPYVPGFLLRIDSADGTNVGITIGTVPAETSMSPLDMQDACTATQAVVAQSATFPGITIGPLDFTTYLTNMGYAVNAHIRGLTFSNVLPGAAEPVGTLTATLDFREVAHLLTLLPTPDPGSACTALEESRMAPCTACADSQPYCLTIAADPVEAIEFTGAFADLAAPGCPDVLRE